MTSAKTITRQSLAGLAREQTVLLIAALFAVLVLISAYLGWSATSTVNAIYLDAVTYLQQTGQPVPPNPVTEGSALGLLRNLPIYVSLIGAFSAIIIGHRLIESDRRAGVLPLLGTRPLERTSYARGKIAALAQAIGGLIVFAAFISGLTLLILPAVSIGGQDWLRLAAFFVLAWGYMMLFGLIALGATAASGDDTSGLLVPTVIWLAITFVLPALTANINPTAAINPVSALTLAPQTPIFDALGAFLGPISLAESFNYLAAGLLGYLPSGITPRGVVPPLPDLVLALGLCAAFALRSCINLDPNGGTSDV